MPTLRREAHPWSTARPCFHFYDADSGRYLGAVWRQGDGWQGFCAVVGPAHGPLGGFGSEAEAVAALKGRVGG